MGAVLGLATTQTYAVLFPQYHCNIPCCPGVPAEFVDAAVPSPLSVREWFHLLLKSDVWFNGGSRRDPHFARRQGQNGTSLSKGKQTGVQSMDMKTCLFTIRILVRIPEAGELLAPVRVQAAKHGVFISFSSVSILPSYVVHDAACQKRTCQKQTWETCLFLVPATTGHGLLPKTDTFPEMCLFW